MVKTGGAVVGEGRSDISEAEENKGGEDLWCSSLLTVCQSRLGLSKHGKKLAWNSRRFWL